MATLLININDEQDERDLLAFLNSRKCNYRSLKEHEINQMSLVAAQSSFSHGWTTDDQEENEYWNSFLK